MDGIHDLGGKQGFGAIVYEADEPAFHGRWEAAVYAMSAALVPAGAMGNIDRFRHAIERIDPVAYLEHTYYGRWLGGIENLLVETGTVTQEEIDDRLHRLHGQNPGRVAARPAVAPDRVEYPPQGREAHRPVTAPPMFAVGDAVTTRGKPSPGHTRLPAYARGKRGEVTAWRQGWVFPDTNAHGLGEQPTHLYTVTFTGAELWGDGAEPGTAVSLDLFEPYLSSEYSSE